MIAITNGKVVTVTDKTYEKGTVLIEDGKSKRWEKESKFHTTRR